MSPYTTPSAPTASAVVRRSLAEPPSDIGVQGYAAGALLSSGRRNEAVA